MQIQTLFQSATERPDRWVRPLVIAEAGVNHQTDMQTARLLIELAHDGGADAIKFQTYRAETLASRHSPAYWDTTREPTTSQYELFKKHDAFWKREFELLKRHCDQVGIQFMSTPFDWESARFLNDLMEVFKISSSDITNRPFIQYIAEFGKPILLSTGASRLSEVQSAVEWIDQTGVPLALLHCILNYPTRDADANLGMMLDLKRHFPGRIIGYSDHTLPRDMKTLEVAAILGAEIVEKHFTHDKTLTGNDHYHAMDRDDLRKFLQSMERVRLVMGAFHKAPLESEEPARRHARRSIVLSRSVVAGEVLSADHLTCKRPAHGISPAHWNEVLGHRVRHALEADHVLTWGDLA
ncbi:MAG: N-acetylneuraminate synthase family protein [Magnetococcales bacterium]|nr:N-acetylneuraminate synthase family protein [Magnetococcales bacterium]